MAKRHGGTLGGTIPHYRRTSGLDPAEDATKNIDEILRKSPLSNEQKLRALHRANETLNERDRQEELFRASPALAVASQILGGMGQDDNPSLADLFIAEVSKPCTGLKGRERKVYEEHMLQYRLDMRKAKRFILDDRFTEMATHMATVPAKKTLARLQYCILPYEQTWIEFNLRIKVRTIREIHKSNNDDYSDVAPRLGMLLQRINDTDAVCTLVGEYEGTAVAHLMCYFFSTVESNFKYPNVPFGCMPLSSLATNFPEAVLEGMELTNITKGSIWGYTGGPTSGVMSDAPPVSEIRLPAFLERHGECGFSRMYYPFKFTISNHKLNEMGSVELREFTGHMRWAATVLAMLNEVPISTDHVQPDRQMRIAHTTRQHRFTDYHKVTLRLPKKNPIKYLERQFTGSGARRRAHEVRSHWRTYMHAQHCGYEKHDWEYDHENGYRLCGKCEAFGRLIHEHVRGDPSLGWVRKDYVIKPSREGGV